MSTLTLKNTYSGWGSCHCCGKKFSRRVSSVPVAFAEDLYYLPKGAAIKSDEEFIFNNIPEGVTVELVLLGSKCTQNRYDNGTLLDTKF